MMSNLYLSSARTAAESENQSRGERSEIRGRDQKSEASEEMKKKIKGHAVENNGGGQSIIHISRMCICWRGKRAFVAEKRASVR
jgi:hypothetical protein